MGSLLAVAVVLVIPACGFDDALTRRGFIEEGDGVCGETIVKTTIALEGGTGAAPGGQRGALGLLADSYSKAAAGIGDLNVADEDVAMRDRIASRFEQAGARLKAVADDGLAGDPQTQTEAGEVLGALAPFLAEVRDYGFELCGGRAPAS